VIKTLKMKIFRYMMEHQTHRYIDQLQNFVESYNGTVHRSLGRSPKSVNKNNEAEVRLEQYLIKNKKAQPRVKMEKKRNIKMRKKPVFKYGVGDKVRISHIRSLFDREYQQKWSSEVFKVAKRYMRERIPVYRLVDLEGEEIKGTFYQQELQGVYVDEDTVYKIEKVLKRRTIGRQKQVLIRWLHWPPKFDSWIPLSELKDYQNS
jgi:hypothetical protein